ncbi:MULTISPECIES: CoA transferase [unclassified Pseudomonas]|uniref:CaiB/BaiF CoA transferase family protein n=1 Tax=unclassified Pseudomonas TaxID=196821 RepID=UPI000D346D44|nr:MULTISPECIES: CoA transferase [unclassified Pseudomonas]RAU48156.1 CoA transferase [Pseudomonas sp. RIT 409]RAU55542.1 CoA transferase [Pseudomonas sp. RIT 412]
MLTDSLKNIRVVDFSHIVAGPVCGMLLGDMGADVIKVEPLDGELGRAIGPPWQQRQSVTSLSVNRNKRGIALDLKTEQGRGIALELMRDADVVIESFRPGVMAKLGLDYDAVKSVNPDVVYCSISAYGQKGPWHQRPGVDGIIQAVTGLMSMLGDPQSSPSKVPIPIADMVTAYLAAISILASLNGLKHQGQGEHLDVSLYNCTLMLQHLSMSSFLATGQAPEKTGSAAPYAAPNEAYKTANGWIMVAAYHPARWLALCTLLEMPELAQDPRFVDNPSRVEHRAQLREFLEQRLVQRTSEDWLPLLEAQDILCAPVANYHELIDTDHYRQSGVQVELDHDQAGLLRMPGFAINSHPESPRKPPPAVGEHTAEILIALGYSEQQIDAFGAAGVIGIRLSQESVA